ncbi:MAG: hypothetical protein JXA79_05080 [Deltaproteobacteria bacterium]|nr:hypothetical protein [Deltaproteobacteria bacterium]
MAFKPNRAFKKEYNRLFENDPQAANLFLLLAELADQEGHAITNEFEIVSLIAVRFTDPMEYQL